MTHNITIRLLKPSDISPHLLASFRRRQVISDKWARDGDRYKRIKTSEIREWDEKTRAWLPQYLLQQMA